MRRPPPPQDWLKYPVTSGVAALAIFVSAAKFGGMDVSFLYMYSNSWHVQIWGLLTSVFPHVDLIHLIFNLYWLWVFGTLVEAVFGPARTAAIMMLFAIGSSGAEFAIFDGGIGLSGVGYGLFALLWLLSRNDERFGGAVDAQTVNLFVVWFFLCIYLTYTGAWRVGNVAHGMGAALGALLGFCIVVEESKRRLLEGILALTVVIDLLLASIGRDYINLSRDRRWEFVSRGYQDIEAHDYQGAIANLQKALKLNTEDPDLWYSLGFAYKELDKIEEATDAVAHAYNLRPSSNQFREILAHCKSLLAYRKHMEGKHAEALELYQQALALDNGNALNWFNMALAQFQLGDVASAKEAVDHAVKLDQTSPEYQKFQDFLQKTLENPRKETGR